MIKRENTIEFVIAGGLGNQLFMLCAGLCYSEKFGRRVTFDVSDLERIAILHPGQNVCELGLISENQISGRQSTARSPMAQTFLLRLFAKITRIIRSFFSKASYRVEEIGFADLDYLPPATKRVEGYFQSWRYFSELKQKPTLDVSSVVEPTDWFAQELKLVQEKEFAAFHIRRGDYTQSMNRNSGILSVEYFQKVYKLLPAGVELFIFTDSPNKVYAELSKTDMKFRIVNPPINSDPVESLILMSKASYIAVSNSTYSWWAATFASEETVVFAPTKWFELRDDPVDLIPKDWIKVRSDWVKQE